MFDASDSDSSDGSDAAHPRAPKFSMVAAAAAAAAKRKPIRGTPSAAEIEAALAVDPKTVAAPRAPPLRESRYIGRLIDRAEERREDLRIAGDKRIAADTPNAETFVTSGYERVLAGAEPLPRAPRPRAPLVPAAPAAPEPVAKRARRSRFADASTTAMPLRGARRNDDAAIAAYRERYFARERARRTEEDRSHVSISNAQS